MPVWHLNDADRVNSFDEDCDLSLRHFKFSEHWYMLPGLNYSNKRNYMFKLLKIKLRDRKSKAFVILAVACLLVC